VGDLSGRFRNPTPDNSQHESVGDRTLVDEQGVETLFYRGCGSDRIDSLFKVFVTDPHHRSHGELSCCLEVCQAECQFDGQVQGRS